MIKIRLSNVIAFHPELVKIFGDVEKALYIQQLYFWSNKGKRKDGYIYKSKKEIEEETGLTRAQQDRCRRFFEKNKIIETKLIKANGSPTLHYRINETIFQKYIDSYEVSISKNFTNGKVKTLPMEKQESYQSITENTTENTTDIKEKQCGLKSAVSSKEKNKDLKDSFPKSKKEKKRENSVEREKKKSEALELTKFFYATLRPNLPAEVISWDKEVRSMKLLLKKMPAHKIKAYIEAIKNCKEFHCLKCNSPTYLYSNLQSIYEELYKK